MPSASTTYSLRGPSRQPPSPGVQIDDNHLDRTWEEIVSARIPSHYSPTPSSDAKSQWWQQWVDALQTAVGDQDSTWAPMIRSVDDLDDQRRRASGSKIQIAAVPVLSYPQSGERAFGRAAEEAASSRALEKASKAAFGSLSPASGGGGGVGSGSSSSSSNDVGSDTKRGPGRKGAAKRPGPVSGQVRNLDRNRRPATRAAAQVVYQANGASQRGVHALLATPGQDHPELPSTNDALAVLIPLLVLLSTLLGLLLLFLVMLILVRRRARIALSLGEGPLDVGREAEIESAGGFDGLEERWLSMQDDATQRGYARAKDWLLSHPPASDPSEITISQFLSIQEKGVSAWSFEPDYEANSACYVEARTEITFVADGAGMAAGEGGGSSVQSNLPLPKINEVYYWEAKMFNKPEASNVAVGLATKPYPAFRMPGWSKFSVGYFSADGFKCHNYPFAAQSYGPAFVQGDVIGVGYRPRSGTVFFTRNGKKLEDAFVGLNRYNLFPTIGCDGPAEVHINLGQAGFVFIEANVKKWGLAPMVGTLAPPPAYGQERGSILIETAGEGSSTAREDARGRSTPPPPLTPLGEHPSRNGTISVASGSANPHQRASVLSIAANAVQQQQQQQRRLESRLEPTMGDSRGRSVSLDSSEGPLNPPTPGNTDIGLHALRGHHLRNNGSGSGQSSASSASSSDGRGLQTMEEALRASRPSGQPISYAESQGAADGYFPPTSPRARSPARTQTRGDRGAQRWPQRQQEHLRGSDDRRAASPGPPPYSAAGGQAAGSSSPFSTATTTMAAAQSGGSLGGTDEAGNQPRRASGRTHRLANALLGAFTDNRPTDPGSHQTGQIQETMTPSTSDRSPVPAILGTQSPRADNAAQVQGSEAAAAYEQSSEAAQGDSQGQGQQTRSRAGGEGWGQSVMSWWQGSSSSNGASS